MTDKKDFAENARGNGQKPEALHLIEDALARLRFGVINLTVHDGKLVQLDITERKRFSA
jgi:hypothetical protein